jgi:hypothetical protein
MCLDLKHRYRLFNLTNTSPEPFEELSHIIHE